VFAVWGDRDRLVPVAHRTGVLTAFPHAQVRIWKGMGHHALQERFGELIEVLAQAAAAARSRKRHTVQPPRKAA
jgi:pimeloyl-ACP methyl ester carboxylesterase